MEYRHIRNYKILGIRNTRNTPPQIMLYTRHELDDTLPNTDSFAEVQVEVAASLSTP